MHNRKKSLQPPSEREIAALQKKCLTYKALVDVIMKKRSSGDHSIETLDVVGKLLQNNPDFYSLWNYRREILIEQHSFLKIGTEDSLASNDGFVKDEELQLSAQCIAKNPKSYSAWYHRVWVLNHFKVDLAQELSLCRDFLKEDQRNFHCWNYRRFVVQKGSLSPNDELDFCEEKIKENFSNYSAFHQRSVFLKMAGKEPREELVMELELVANAVFTEPDDQSAWWYHQFLLSWAWQSLVKMSGAELSIGCEWFATVLRQQLDAMRSLLEMEPSCHWVMTALVSTLQHLRYTVQSGLDLEEEEQQLSSEQRNLLTRLVEVDPMHANRYKYMLRAVS